LPTTAKVVNTPVGQSARHPCRAVRRVVDNRDDGR
jgi:hypothetical protein